MHSKATRCLCPRIRFKYFIGQSFSGIRRLLICSVSSSLVLFIRAAAQPPGDVGEMGGQGETDAVAAASGGGGGAAAVGRATTSGRGSS